MGQGGSTFSRSVQKKEAKAANHRCRMCGSAKNLVFVPILYGQSKKIREGELDYTCSKKFHSSYNNCLLLCANCKFTISHLDGLNFYNVDYLFLLKAHSEKCPYPINVGGHAVKCIQPRKDWYCSQHEE